MPAPKSPEFGEKPIAQIAKDLGIAESGLRRWMKQADVDEGGAKDGLTSDERAQLVRLRREERVLKMEVEILKRASRLLRPGERAPKIVVPVVQELAADDVPVAVPCRVLLTGPAAQFSRLRRRAEPARSACRAAVGTP